MRQIIEIQSAGGTLFATRHEPEEASSIGALIVNFGPIPRTGVGDLAVRIAEELCAKGMSVYRIDLPGVGDSNGDLPEREEPYFEAIQQGANAQLVGQVAEAIVREHGLDGVIVVGLCSGAWTAGYAAQRSPAVKGLVMLEPELRVTPPAAGEHAGKLSRLWKLTSPLAWTRLMFGENRLSSRLGRVRSVGYRLLLRLTGERMPSDTHWPLLTNWKDAARRKLPVLVVTAARSWREMYVLRALEWLNRRVPAHRFSHVAVEGTNHIFAAGNGAARVLPVVARWAEETFLSDIAREEVAADVIA